MSIPMLIYTPERSNIVLEKSEHFLGGTNLKQEISDLLWVYQSAIGTIPHTNENMWSGHFFPATESQEELQVSCNLCLFGFYKQAMVSTRSGLELGLLSVYWNLSDNGHVEIKNWLNSKQNTPRFSDVWKKLEKNQSIKNFQTIYDLKSRLLELGYLHNFVHTKGHKFSNHIGLIKSNYQTFEEKGFVQWLSAFREVIEIITILHLLKYPISTIEFIYEDKFGIDIPMFGGLNSSQLKLIKKIIGEGVFQHIKDFNKDNTEQQEFLNWLNSLPDLTKEEKEEKIIELDKMNIEQMGFFSWVKQEEKIYKEFWDSKEIKLRIRKLKSWAEEMKYLKPKLER